MISMQFPIYSKEGLVKCHTNSLEYQGKWMGESFVQASVISSTPIEFALGDYILYNGQRYEINYDPAVIKQARSGSVGNAFKYDNIKFNGFSDELTRCRFLDFVSGDNEVHYSYLPKFSFFCKDINDFVLRIQANLDRMYKDWAVIVTEETRAASQLQIDIDDKSIWEALELISTKFKTSFVVRQAIVNGVQKKAIVIGEEVFVDHDVLMYGKGNGLTQIQASTENNQQIITRLRAYGSTKNIPFHYYSGIRDANGELLYTYDPWFKYPYIDIPEGETKIPFGWSLPDIPTGETGRKVLFLFCGPFVQGDRFEIEFTLSNTPNVKRTGILEYKQSWVDAANKKYKRTGFIFGGLIYNFEKEPDRDNFINEIRRTRASVTITKGLPKSVLGQHKDIWIYPPYTVTPDAMAVNNLMLPDFLAFRVIEGKEGDKPLYLDIEEDKQIFYGATEERLNPVNCERVLDEEKGREELEFVVGYKYTNGKYYRAVFDRDKNNRYKAFVNYDSFIEDADAVARYGIREGCVFFDKDDPDNDISEIYPTIQGMTADAVKGAGYQIELPKGDNGFLDEVLSGTDTTGIHPIVDDGIPDDTSTAQTEPGNFTIYVKDLGFDMRDFLSTENMVIHMRSGWCGERDFELVNSTNNPRRVWLKQREEDYKLLDSYETDAVPAYEITLVRKWDDALQCYFPNLNNPISGKLVVGPRPEDGDKQFVKHADRFIIVNIDLPRLYVDAASQLLKSSAEEYLAKNVKSKKTYVPTLDPVYIAKDRERCIEAGDETKSLHYALKEGNILRFKDEDLGVENGDNVMLFIDTITIKEGQKAVPEYSITLKEEKEFSTIQKIQNQITAVSSLSGSMLSPMQVKALAQSVTKGNYLSKVNDDTANGVIRFKKQPILDAGFVTDDYTPGGFDGTGAALTKTEQGTRFEVDYLTIRKRLEALELQIQKMSHIGGQVILSAASANIFYVEYVGELNAYRCYFLAKDGEGNEITNDWVVGDQARCQTFNLETDEQGVTRNHYWWRLVTAVSTSPVSVQKEDGEVVTCHWFDVYAGNDDIEKCDISSGEPQSGDAVVLVGHQGLDVSRANVIIEAGAGSGSPYHRQYKGVKQFAFLPENLKIDLNPVSTSLEVEELAINVKGEKKDVGNELESLATGVADVTKQLDGKFDIYQLEDNAPVDEEGELPRTLSVSEVAEYDEELDWRPSEYSEHVGDFILFHDGVCYMFTERYVWELREDRYLVAYIEQLAEQQKKLKDMESDQKLTPVEKQQLWIMWKEAEKNFKADSDAYNAYYDYEEVGISFGAYTEVFFDLQNVLYVEQAGSKRGLLADLGMTSDITSSVLYPFSSLADGFSKLESARTVYLQTIADVSKGLGDKAVEELSKMADDNVVTPSEKTRMRELLREINAESGSLIRMSEEIGVGSEEYGTMKRAIEAFIDHITANMEVDTYLVREDGFTLMINTGLTRPVVTFQIMYVDPNNLPSGDWHTYNQMFTLYVSERETLRATMSVVAYEHASEIEDPSDLTRDILDRLGELNAKYGDVQQSVVDLQADYGALITTSGEQKRLTDSIITTSGIITEKDKAALFASYTVRNERGEEVSVNAAIASTFIQDGVGHFMVRADNIYFQGKAFNVSTEDITISAGVGDKRFFYLGSDGLEINTKGLKLDKEGNAEFSGELKAATGTFSGELKAATGTFGGSVLISYGESNNTILSGSLLEMYQGGAQVSMHIDPNTNQTKVYLADGDGTNTSVYSGAIEIESISDGISIQDKDGNKSKHTAKRSEIKNQRGYGIEITDEGIKISSRNGYAILGPSSLIFYDNDGKVIYGHTSNGHTAG